MSIATDPKRRALGKGLESLLPSRPAAGRSAGHHGSSRNHRQATGNPPGTNRAKSLPNPHPVRRRKANRTSPLHLRLWSSATHRRPPTHPAKGEVKYQLITGERRWLASRKAGKTTIPAIVRQVSDEQTLEMTIVENLQRADLNPMEQARAYQRLSQDFKLTQEQMAQRTGKERASVSNFLRLLRLPESVQQKVESGDLTFGHARTLLALDSAESITSAAQKVLALSICLSARPKTTSRA